MTKGFEYGLYIGRKYMPISDQVFIAQSKVIEEIAGKGCCVIVGRCADHILRDNKNSIHIFIHAPLSSASAGRSGNTACSQKTQGKL